MKFDVELSGAVPLTAKLETEPQTMNTEMGQVMQVGSEVEIDPVPTEGSKNAVSSGGVHAALEKKLNAENPTATGSISLNRKAGTAVGASSVAYGEDSEASGRASYAEGYQSQAINIACHAEGYQSKANGYYSHAQGNKAQTQSACAHAEGNNTIASGKSQHVQGEWNIEDPTPNATSRGTYAHIVGNGSKNGRSNAHTLDWKGTAWFAGDVYVGGTQQSEGKKLATVEEVVSGEGGGYYTPKVSQSGTGTMTVAFTASGADMPAVEPVTVTLPQGTPGEDGYTPIKGVDYSDGTDGTSVTVKSVNESTADGGSNVITFSDGKTIVIKNGSKGSTGATGAKGDKGDTGATGAKGADGHTPVKGTDYWTAVDRAEIVKDVLAALPTWTGGSY